jgi:hypothetical protein
LLRDADQMSRKCSCLHAPPLIELAEMSYSLLNDATTDTNALPASSFSNANSNENRPCANARASQAE